MMQGLLTLWLCAALPGLLCASPLLVERDNDTSKICKPAPHWEIKGHGAPMKELLGNVVVLALLKASWHFCRTQASKLGGLRDKLLRSKLTDVSFLIVNEREAQSRAMYWELKRRAPPGIPVYQQAPLQDDVWEALDGDKDDFLVYDRCGRLTFHIVLPYSFLHYPYIEAAVRATYHKDICGNLTVDSNMTSSAGCTQRNETLSSSEIHDTARPIDVDTVSNPAPSDGRQMSSYWGGNMSHIHHHQHQHHQQQHNHGSGTDKQDSN